MSTTPETRTLKLTYPITIGKENPKEITEVKWKMPIKWKIMKHMYRGDDEGVRQTNFLSALLAEPPSTIDELHVMDVGIIMKEIEPFFENIKALQAQR